MGSDSSATQTFIGYSFPRFSNLKQCPDNDPEEFLGDAFEAFRKVHQRGAELAANMTIGMGIEIHYCNYYPTVEDNNLAIGFNMDSCSSFTGKVLKNGSVSVILSKDMIFPPKMKEIVIDFWIWVDAKLTKYQETKEYDPFANEFELMDKDTLKKLRSTTRVGDRWKTFIWVSG